MYFWHIDALKRDLRGGDLTQSAVFAYLLGETILLTLLSNPAFLGNDLSNAHNWIVTLVNVCVVTIGTMAAYRANGGDAGQFFLTRLVALSWVLGIRLMAFLLVPLVLLYVLLSPDAQGGGALMFADLLCTLLFSVVFYWRLARHMRDVAAPARATAAGAAA